MQLWGKASQSSNVFEQLLGTINDYLEDRVMSGEEDLNFLKGINDCANKVVQDSSCKCDEAVRATVNVANAMSGIREAEELRMCKSREITKSDYVTRIVENLALLMASLCILATHADE